MASPVAYSPEPQNLVQRVNAPHAKGIAYLDDVEHGDKLREHEDLVSRRKEGVEEPLEDHRLPARVNELLVHGVTVHAWSFEQDASKPCTSATRCSVGACCWSVSLFSPRGVAEQR
jgi:hypothetical protein